MATKIFFCLLLINDIIKVKFDCDNFTFVIFVPILQSFIYSGTCLIWHTKGPVKYVRLYRMSESVQSDIPRDQWNMSDCTGCQNLSNLTYQGTSEICQIVQDVRTCPIWHTKGPVKYVRLYRMSEPVQSNILRDQRNMSDCTGCQNLSNLTYQGTSEICQIVQDVRTCPIRHIKVKYVRLYRMLEYSGFILVNRNTFGPYIFVGCHRMSENSGVGLHKFHCIAIFYQRLSVEIHFFQVTKLLSINLISMIFLGVVNELWYFFIWHNSHEFDQIQQIELVEKMK
jgi:hypothetical protein